MYCILKILNNNALLAKVKEDDSERILLGKGIGFGRKAGNSGSIGLYAGGSGGAKFYYECGKYH